VRPLEQLERHVGDPDRCQLRDEDLRPDVEVVVVGAAGIDPDRPLGPQRGCVQRDHPDGIPGQPACPDRLVETTRTKVERYPHGAVLIRRETSPHRPRHHHTPVVGFESAGLVAMSAKKFSKLES